MDARNDKDTVKLSLHVSSEFNDVLTELASTAHTSKSEILRRAIVLMQLALEAKQSGQKFGVASSEDNKLTREIAI